MARKSRNSEYINSLRKQLTDGKRKSILARDNYKCHYCGEEGRTVDHVIPLSKGGTNDLSNLVCACEECNNIKGDEAVYGLKYVLNLKFS